MNSATADTPQPLRLVTEPDREAEATQAALIEHLHWLTNEAIEGRLDGLVYIAKIENRVAASWAGCGDTIGALGMLSVGESIIKDSLG